MRVRSANCIDETSAKADPAVVREMMRVGMVRLNGDKDYRDSWRRFLFRLRGELGVAAPRLLLEQVTSKELSEWAAYLRSLDDVREPAPRPVRDRPPAVAGDDPAVSWQRLLSFADRVNTSRGSA